MAATSHVRLFGLALLCGATQLRAQVTGDSVRLRLGPRAPWIKGRLIRSDSIAIILRTTKDTQEYRFADVARLDRWKRDNVVVRLVTGTVAGLAGWELGRTLNGDGRSITGSRGGDLALGTGLGLLTAGVIYAVHPASWHRVRRRPAAAP